MDFGEVKARSRLLWQFAAATACHLRKQTLPASPTRPAMCVIVVKYSPLDFTSHTCSFLWVYIVDRKGSSSLPSFILQQFHFFALSTSKSHGRHVKGPSFLSIAGVLKQPVRDLWLALDVNEACHALRLDPTNPRMEAETRKSAYLRKRSLVQGPRVPI